MRILVAVPTFENICPETFKSIYQMKKPDGVKVDFDFIKGYDCAKARNEIAKKAVGGVYDYVLMVDSDMIVQEDILERMLEYPTDIVLGIAPVKNTKTKLVEIVKSGNKSFNERFTAPELPDEPRFAVRGGGMSCAMIRTSVFKVLKYPWFNYEVYENGSCLSEDYYFCWKARQAGLNIEADTRVRTGHLARYFQWE